MSDEQKEALSKAISNKGDKRSSTISSNIKNLCRQTIESLPAELKTKYKGLEDQLYDHIYGAVVCRTADDVIAETGDDKAPKMKEVFMGMGLAEEEATVLFGQLTKTATEFDNV